MAIGRYRDEPGEFDEDEQRIAAAQYPEGGLVLGALVALLIGWVVSDILLVAGPALGGMVGFGLGRQYRARKMASLVDDE